MEALLSAAACYLMLVSGVSALPSHRDMNTSMHVCMHGLNHLAREDIAIIFQPSNIMFSTTCGNVSYE